MKASTLRRLINLWPPYLFAGIRVKHIAEDWSNARVQLKLTWYNRNAVKTQFGGNLFSMTDPFWMLLLMQSLGPNYVVWDKQGSIEFIAPGREHVYADFALTQHVLDTIQSATANGDKCLHWFELDIKTASGKVVAKVRKQVYVRLKPKHRPRSDECVL